MTLSSPDKRWVQDFGDNRWLKIDGAFNAISPTTARGDIIAQGVSGDTNLPIGRQGQILTVNPLTSTRLEWGEPLNPRYKTIILDDFTAYYGFSYTGTTGAGASIFGATSDTNPGQLGGTTGTTSSGGSIIGQPTGNRIISLTGSRQLYLEWLVWLEALSTAAQEYIVFIGFHDNGTSITASHPNNGAYFYYDRITNGNNWYCRCVSGGTNTEVNTGVAVTASSFNRFRIDRNGSNIIFQINGATVATISGNIPTGALSFSISIVKKAGTTSRYILADYYYLTQEVSR